MNSITFACFSCLCLLTLQALGQPAKNEFPIVIEGVKCSVKAYKPTAPIVFELIVDKDSLPKSELIIAIIRSVRHPRCLLKRGSECDENVTCTVS